MNAEQLNSTPDGADPPIHRRRAWLGLAAICIAVAIGWMSWRSARESRVYGPHDLNVLLITLDTTRADALGCYGRGSARTPNLDRLAREGVRFAECSTCSPQTLPAHASIMTGVYPFVHGARKNGTYRLADPNVTLAERLKQAGFRTGAAVASFVLNGIFGMNQGFDTYSDVPAGDSLIALHAERPGDDVCDDALGTLRKLKSNRFFFWVHFYDAHYPYLTHGAGATEEAGLYQEEVDFVDDQIGRLVSELRKLGLDRRTLVVVVGDHGEAFGEHAEMQHGYFLYETTLHVPLIIHCPAVVPAGRTVNTRVRTIDIAPTVLDLLGEAPLVPVEGQSLRALLQGEPQASEPAAYSESLDAYLQFHLSPVRSLATDAWKYILSPKPALYDLSSDPGESRNVVEERPEVAADLRGQLRTLIAEAPPPPAADAAGVDLTTAEMAQLQSLGYIGGTTAPSGTTSELDLFEPRGGDPADFTDVLRQYGEAHWALMTGEFRLAEERLLAVIAAMPGAARVRGDLAYALQQQNKTIQAVDAYRTAIALAPEDGYVRRMYAGLLMRLQRWDEAIAQLDKVVAERPDDFEAQYNLGVACGFARRFEEARRHLEAALQVNPKHASSLHAIGATYVQENNLAKAAEYFRKALAVDPTHARAREDLARLGQQP